MLTLGGAAAKSFAFTIPEPKIDRLDLVDAGIRDKPLHDFVERGAGNACPRCNVIEIGLRKFGYNVFVDRAIHVG